RGRMNFSLAVQGVFITGIDKSHGTAFLTLDQGLYTDGQVQVRRENSLLRRGRGRSLGTPQCGAPPHPRQAGMRPPLRMTEGEGMAVGEWAARRRRRRR